MHKISVIETSGPLSKETGAKIAKIIIIGKVFASTIKWPP
jgi:hypothetical protein